MMERPFGMGHCLSMVIVQLNGDTLIGLNLRLSLQELQVQTKLSTQEEK